MDNNDENYENIFSDTKNFKNSSFYKITPDITNNTTDDSGEYIYDDSFF